MKAESKLSFSIIRKLVFVSVILLVFCGIVSYAANSNLNYVKIIYSDGYETAVITDKTNVRDILTQKGIILLEDEVVYPREEANIDFTKTITVQKQNQENVVVAEQVLDITTEEILNQYSTITEKIITEQVEIPFETVTKDVSTTGNEQQSSVLQEGQNGIKEIKYRVKYQDDKEIERVLISETVVQEPVEKIIQVSNKITSRASTSARTGSRAASLAQSVEGKTPVVRTLNASAYSGDSSTASGARPSANYTVAAGKSLPFGTVVYIPYFANSSNGGWFIVQDRGGAISDNRIDIYMSSEAACNRFGRRNLEVYIYE